MRSTIFLVATVALAGGGCGSAGGGFRLVLDGGRDGQAVVRDGDVPGVDIGEGLPDLAQGASCNNGRKDGVETDVDCGGATCGKCASGRSCLVPGDCQSGRCVDGTCAAPTCNDGLKDQDETDVDCGGTHCSPCADGRSCLGHGDCLSAMCANGRCAAAPACNDGLKNGGETDVDCGGPRCNGCQNGRGCAQNADCVSKLCKNLVCTAVASCNDNLLNQDETDIDCGGNTCAKCGANKKCVFGSDCQSNLCSGGLCKAGNKVNVGSFDPYIQGPPWGNNPPVLSCVETCAMLFGGLANSYGCSTQPNVLDNKAWLDGYADTRYCVNPAADNFKVGVNYDCGMAGCSYSAWVRDNPACDKVNYCWR